jgi:hypothetical protein
MIPKKCLLDICDDIEEKLRKGWKIEPDDYNFVMELKKRSDFSTEDHDKAIIIEAGLMIPPAGGKVEEKEPPFDIYKANENLINSVTPEIIEDYVTGKIDEKYEKEEKLPTLIPSKFVPTKKNKHIKKKKCSAKNTTSKKIDSCTERKKFIIMEEPDNDIYINEPKSIYKLDGKLEKRKDKYFIKCQNVDDFIEYFEGKRIKIIVYDEEK